MKRAAAVAAMFALLALPGIAQRGGAHGGFGGGHASGGFAGHAGGFGGHSGFGGGFASHFGGFASHGSGFAPRFGGFAPRYGNFSSRFGSYAPRGYAPRGFAPRYGNFRPSGFVPRGYAGTGRYAPRSGAGLNRAPYRGNEYGRLGNEYAGNRYGGGHGRGRHHRPFYNGFNGLPYAYDYGAWPGYGFEIDPWSLGPDWLDYDDSDQSAQNEYGGNVPAPYPDYGEPPYGEPAPGYGEPAPDAYAAPQVYPPTDTVPYPQQDGPQTRYSGSAASGAQQAVTVIFKNGRPPETVHNYMLTASTMTVLDGRYQQIPIDQIDVPATEAANRAAGANFRVPGPAN
jgi:hypothetical protein